MSDYPYDPDVLDDLARRLYEALPAMYRAADEPPGGRGDLARLLDVLAGPLAVLRQSIRELHADLFVDTAHDRIVPYLAEMVGTRLVFPDAPSNRRDVRGTIDWRQRKGTPPALEEMGSELTGQPVVLQEGWKRIQVVQDLNLVRDERVVVDLRPAVVAEQASGPLDALAHAVDMRPITARSGRRHPRHVAHWLHTTVAFPLRGATTVDRSVPPDSDVRHAMHALGGRHPLRARRVAGETGPFVDRVPEQHFATTPERWFDREGGFVVRICELAAGIAGAPAAERVAGERVASPRLGRGEVSIALLDRPSRGWRGGVAIELGLATVTSPGPDTWQPNPGTFDPRARIELDAGGVVAATSAGGPTPGGPRVPLLRVAPLGGAPGCFFPGATLAITSAAPGAESAAADSQLARAGFLEGALHVTIPPLDLRGERLLHVGADGSVYEAQRAGAVVAMPAPGGELRLAPDALAAAGPGAAWPPLPEQAEPRMLDRVPGAPGRGPVVMHGARALRRTAGGLDPLPAGTGCALAFAVALERPGGPAYRPFQRLDWTGPDPAGATWTALGADGAAVGVQDVAVEYAAVARLREAEPDGVALAVRFECSAADATLCPGEVAWSADDGRTVLIHLPQLDALAAGADPWPVEAPLASASAPVRVAEDGSTWAPDSTAARRSSLGAVAPIAGGGTLRRRRVRWRRLCAWDREDRSASPPEVLESTAPGRLDVDVTHGLFACSADEPPQGWPPAPGGGDPPPSVTTDHEEGATMHLGARPAAREPILDMRQPRPTRLVSRGGALHPDAPTDWHDIPRYASLTQALAAVSARWQALTPDDVAEPVAEVVQFEDSATYPGEAPVWPDAPGSAATREQARLELTLQAAERERPVVLVDPAQGWTAPAPRPRYDAIALRGIAFGGEGWDGMALPPAAHVSLELCTLLDAANELHFADVDDGAQVTVTLCETAGLRLAGAGTLTVTDSIVEARPGRALRAAAGEAVLKRVSVGGEVAVRVLEASEVIFEGRVEVEDRFRGCVRYSRAPGTSTLPRVHRVAFDVPVRLVSRNRRDAAWWRLRADCDAAISRGAENGSEMGAFSLTRLAKRTEGFERRLGEFTPAGLVTAIIRID